MRIIELLDVLRATKICVRGFWSNLSVLCTSVRLGSDKHEGTEVIGS
jgi:hypothetical protein